jgi:hypothetical protein
MRYGEYESKSRRIWREVVADLKYHRGKYATVRIIYGLDELASKKIRVKLSLCLTNSELRHEDVWGSGCIDPRILDLGTSRRWVVSSTPRQLYPWGMSPWYPLDRRLGGLQNRSGRCGIEKNLASTGTRTPTPGSRSQIKQYKHFKVRHGNMT